MNLYSFLALYTKTNPNASNSNVRAKTLKLSEDRGEDLPNLELGNGFLDMTLEAQAIKEKLISWLSSKFKAFMLQTVPLIN